MINPIFKDNNYDWADDDSFHLFISIIAILALLLIAIALYRYCTEFNRNTAFGDKLYNSLRQKSAPLLVISRPRSNIPTDELSLSLDDKIYLSLKKQLSNKNPDLTIVESKNESLPIKTKLIELNK